MSGHDTKVERCRYCEMPTVLDEDATLHLKWCPNHQASTCVACAEEREKARQ